MLTLSLIFVGCDDYLDAPSESQITEENVFSNAEMAEGFIMGIYHGFGEDRSYRNRLTTYMGVNTDIEMHTGSKDVNDATNDRKALATYQISSALDDGFQSANSTDPWSRMYSMIERANLAIKGIRKYGNPESGTKMGYLLGEALTLRAFLYNDLCKFWGDVPARFEPLTTETLFVGVTDRDQIYDQLLMDLDEATSLVGWPGEITQTATVERINKGFVLGLKARVALMYAGKSLRLEGGTKVVKQNVSDEKRRELYVEANNALKQIYNSQKFTLSASFEQIFKDQCTNVITNGRDAMFELPFSGTRGQILSYLGLRQESPTKYASVAIKNEVGIVPSFFYDYDAHDLRRDVTVVPYKWVADTIILDQVSNFRLAKWRAEWSSTKITSNDDGINFCVMRYADVLLLLAETENELYNGPTDLAKTAFKDVRRRAFAPSLQSTVDAYVDALSSKEDFFNALVNERAFEFAGENVRKWDLMRWGMLKSKMDEAKSNMTNLRDGLGKYADVPATLYWYKASAEEIVIYGLNRGETEDKRAEDTSKPWIRKSWTQSITTTTNDFYLSDSFISSLYKADPDMKQILPIMNVIISNSQGQLTNRYY